MSYTFTYKPPEWLKLPDQVRLSTSEGFSDWELRQLGESMKVRQLAPVGAKPDATLLWGFRRVRAAILVKLKQLAVIITDENLSESEIKVIQLTENMQRFNLTGYEQWQACAELMKLNPSWTAVKLAEHLNKDNSLITRILAPSKLIPRGQESLKKGTITLAHCYPISQVPAEQQDYLLDMAEAGCPRDEIARVVRKSLNGTKKPSTARMIKITIPLPGGGSFVLRQKGLDMGALVDTLDSLLKKAKKSAATYDLRTWEQMMGDEVNKGRMA
jgi:ParB/RepB/Spo0J family partition protein